mmetsp:Transcript_28599/g.50855  ORF Transcript_28599/g.50855 Transcript_28599/m.50855 type:complete len:175 (-) Transcript_28599:3242-3766(-)
MIPLIKLVSLMTRTFSRPAANYFSRRLRKTKDSVWISNALTYLGRESQDLINSLENKLRKDKGEEELKFRELSDREAKDVGIELSVEIALYASLFAFGYYEYHKLTKEAQAREEEQHEAIKKLQSEMERVTQQLSLITNSMQEFQRMSRTLSKEKAADYNFLKHKKPSPAASPL